MRKRKKWYDFIDNIHLSFNCVIFGYVCFQLNVVLKKVKKENLFLNFNFIGTIFCSCEKSFINEKHGFHLISIFPLEKIALAKSSTHDKPFHRKQEDSFDFLAPDFGQVEAVV